MLGTLPYPTMIFATNPDCDPPANDSEENSIASAMKNERELFIIGTSEGMSVGLMMPNVKVTGSAPTGLQEGDKA